MKVKELSQFRFTKLVTIQVGDSQRSPNGEEQHQEPRHGTLLSL